MLKLATEIATPFNEKPVAAKPGSASRRAATAAPAPRTVNHENGAPGTMAHGAAAPAQQSPGSIDKHIHPSTPAASAENEFRKATELLNRGRVAEAIDGYKLALQRDAGHAAARQALVGLLLENRRIEEAQQYLQEGLSLYPDRYAYAILLARIQVDRGDLQGAHDLLRKYAGSAANDAEYHAFDAALLQRLGRHKEAVAGYQAALKLVPGAAALVDGPGHIVAGRQSRSRGAGCVPARQVRWRPQPGAACLRRSAPETAAIIQPPPAFAFSLRPSAPGVR